MPGRTDVTDELLCVAVGDVTPEVPALELALLDPALLDPALLDPAVEPSFGTLAGTVASHKLAFPLNSSKALTAASFFERFLNVNSALDAHCGLVHPARPHPSVSW